MASSRWLTMEVRPVLLLVVILMVAVIRVNCNYTIAVAAMHEMVEDPEAAAKSWGSIGNEALEWGERKIENGLGLNHTDSSACGDAAQTRNDDGELSNIAKEAKSEAYQTVNKTSDKANQKAFVTAKKIREATPEKTYLAANETAKKAKEWRDIVQDGAKKTSEATQHAKEKVYETAKEAANKASSMKNATIKKGQEVKGMIQENVVGASNKVKAKAEHQKEMDGQKVEDVREKENREAQNGKDETSNDKRRTVIEGRKVVEEWKEFEVKEKAEEGHDDLPMKKVLGTSTIRHDEEL